MFRGILKSAAYHGDAQVYEALTSAVVKSSDSNVRAEIYKALGSFRDPVLRRQAFAFFLSDKVDPREAQYMFEAAGELPENAAAMQAFLRENYPAIEKKLPEEAMAHAPRWGRELCTAQDRSAYQSFFRDRAGKYPGGARNFAQSLEAIDICVDHRKVQEGRLKRFLSAQK
jgi:hypothetical protein